LKELCFGSLNPWFYSLFQFLFTIFAAFHRQSVLIFY
jgi:hypothetical protein